MRPRLRVGRGATSSTAVAVASLVVGVVLAGCGEKTSSAGPTPVLQSSTSAAASPTPTPASQAPATSPTPSPTDDPDPRWRFYTDDRGRHTSPWFEGSHRVMIGYGCNPAPWYAHDPRCPGRQGFHHGIDVAIPCGTPLLSAVDGVVVDPSSAGAPGSAYGTHPFRIRSGDHDVLIGHTTRVFVRPGQEVHAGQRIALVGDSGAPDGCHLHFEVRRAGGGLSSTINPAPLLNLS